MAGTPALRARSASRGERRHGTRLATGAFCATRRFDRRHQGGPASTATVGVATTSRGNAVISP